MSETRAQQVERLITESVARLGNIINDAPYRAEERDAAWQAFLQNKHHILAGAQALRETPLDALEELKVEYRELQTGAVWMNGEAIRQRVRAEKAEAELAALRETPAQTWQPIETAPYHMPVLVYRPGMHEGDRIAVRKKNDWCGPKCCPSAEPTHWMPLPVAPPALDPSPETKPTGALALAMLDVLWRARRRAGRILNQ